MAARPAPVRQRRMTANRAPRPPRDAAQSPAGHHVDFCPDGRRLRGSTAVAAMLKTIFAQDSKAEAEAQWETVAFTAHS